MLSHFIFRITSYIRSIINKWKYVVIFSGATHRKLDLIPEQKESFHVLTARRNASGKEFSEIRTLYIWTSIQNYYKNFDLKTNKALEIAFLTFSFISNLLTCSLHRCCFLLSQVVLRFVVSRTQIVGFSGRFRSRNKSFPLNQVLLFITYTALGLL